MTTGTIVDQLVASGVFAESDDEDLQLTRSFREAVADHRESLSQRDADGVREAVAASTDNEETASRLCEGSEYDPEFLARYVAVGERIDDLAPGRTLALAVVVRQLKNELPRAEGAPRTFLPVHGEELVHLVSLYERCVVYAWREDCSPCDLIREDFDEIFSDGAPEDVMLLAVYGPDCATLLNREFDVVGAPTTLFTLNGSVDARLVGAPRSDALEREIETIRERTLPSA
jgi:hypothetical protein